MRSVGRNQPDPHGANRIDVVGSVDIQKHRHAVRDAHAKSHGVLAGEPHIHDVLPDELDLRDVTLLG